MWADKGVNIYAISICIIMLIPFVFQFSRVLTRYLLNKYFSKKDVYVTYKEDGKIVSKFKLCYMHDGSVNIKHEKIKDQHEK